MTTRAKGHCDGKTIVLDQPVAIQGEVEVDIIVPDPENAAKNGGPNLRWHWDHAKEVGDTAAAAHTRTDVSPSGLPIQMPSEEEWQERAKRVAALMEQWMAEEPSDDLATWEELEEGLKNNPVRFREISLDD